MVHARCMYGILSSSQVLPGKQKLFWIFVNKKYKIQEKLIAEVKEILRHETRNSKATQRWKQRPETHGYRTLGGSELQSPAGETFIVEIQPVLHIDPPTSFFSLFEPPKSLPFTESVEIWSWEDWPTGVRPYRSQVHQGDWTELKEEESWAIPGLAQIHI